MDERSTQIREGAGQLESKLNTEFIDWLRKWHMPILLVAALAALSFVGYQRWQQYKSAKVAAAFGELWTTTSPEALRSLAVTHEGQRAVPMIARLQAADIYLKAARTGVKPGAMPQQDGTGAGGYAAADLMSEEERGAMLGQAASLYQEVLAAVGEQQGKAIHALNAAYGLAAVAESRGELDQAKRHYEEAARIAEWGGYPQQAAIARGRIEKLPRLAEMPKLYAEAELPKPPEPPAAEPAATPVENLQLNPGVPFQLNPVPQGETPGEPLQPSALDPNAPPSPAPAEPTNPSPSSPG